MQTTILTLSNVFNFIPCPESPPIKSSIHNLQEFYHIHSHLMEFIKQDHDSKYVFEELSLFLNKEEEVLGPRKFRKLIEDISTVVLEYVIVKFRNEEVDRGVLCLTYYQKYIKKYMTTFINILMNFTYCLAHFSKNTYNAMVSYLVQTKRMITAFKDPSQVDLQLLQSTFEGIYFFHSKKISKSKSFFSELVSKVTSRIHDQKMKTREVQPLTVTLFVLSTYFLSQTYRQMGEVDVSNYNLTQCFQFAESHLPDCEYLFALCEGSVLVDNRRVKLSRIENKIQRIKSLHFSSKHSSGQTSFQNSTKQSQADFKIKTKVKKVHQKTMTKQLDNLFMLHENKDYSVKKRTLKALHFQLEKKENQINKYTQDIKGFNSQKISLHQHFNLDQHQQTIITIQDQKKALKQQIKQQIWDVVDSLKPTKKLQSYIMGFKTALNYQNTNKFYRILCSEVSIMGQIVFFIMFKRFKSKMKTIAIRQIIYKGIKHQIQFKKHKIYQTFHIKVYNIESGSGIDDLVQVGEQTFNSLQSEPLEYHFENDGKKLVPFQEYLNNMDETTLFYVKLCNAKLRRRQLKREKRLTYAKKQVYITFQQYQTDLSYTLFIRSQQQKNGLYLHKIERIDTVKHNNADYNLKFNKIIQDSSQQILYESDLDVMLTQEIISRKTKYVSLILKIQSIMRRKISHNTIKKKSKEGPSVMTMKIKDNLFTLTINGYNRIFYIEHLYNKYPKLIVKNVDYNSLSFINNLREKLLRTEDCSQQMKIIEKYFILRNIYRKLTHRSKQMQLDNNFSTKFKTSLCFAKKTQQILYKDKKVDVLAMFMLTVSNFEVCPRTYLLRVFNLKAESLYSFNVELKIEMQEKLYLENNLDKIYEHVDIIGYKQAIIMMEGPAKSIPKSRRINSKSTILSNYSFGSGQDFSKERPVKQRLITRLQNRQSYAFTRNKKNSINFKHRHKSALKQKDVAMIRKWIEECKDSIDNVSEQSQISN